MTTYVFVYRLPSGELVIREFPSLMERFEFILRLKQRFTTHEPAKYTGRVRYMVLSQ